MFLNLIKHGQRPYKLVYVYVHEIHVYKLTLMAASKCPSVRPSITPAVVPARLRRQEQGMNTSLTPRGKYDAKVSLTIN